jgi:WS/DGAT/MGAT family acyltransferase
MDSPREPEQFGVVLLLDGGPAARVARTMAGRVAAVPRLRQRLVRAPWGCGGPIWIDDAAFDIDRHVRMVDCANPADQDALVTMALAAISSPLPRDRPLWSATVISGPTGATCAVVIVLHHVLADGIGGLAIMSGLIDAPRSPIAQGFPRPAPSPTALARDAIARRIRAVRHVRRGWRRLLDAMRAGGGIRPRRATPCSLVHRTGPHRRVVVIRTDLATVREIAHQNGGTVNDAILVAVADALQQVLSKAGERADPVVVTVPVSGRQSDDTGAGNLVSPMLVSVPTSGPFGVRLAAVSEQVRAQRGAASGPPPIAVLGWLFRPLAALGGFRWYMRHQHRMHTLVTNVRGPTESIRFDGAPVTSIIPIVVGPAGNVPVQFDVLSYAGDLVVTVVADADWWVGADDVAAALQAFVTTFPAA